MLIKLHIDKHGQMCLNSQVAIENLLQILFLVREKLFAQDLIGLNDLRKSKESKESKNINYTGNATEREKKVKTNDERERERQREKKRKERK